MSHRDLKSGPQSVAGDDSDQPATIDRQVISTSDADPDQPTVTAPQIPLEAKPPSTAAYPVDDGRFSLDADAETIALQDADGDASTLPHSIGPYAVRSILGQGGMGAVFLGEQKEPVERLVAIKLIHASLTGPAALHRFTAERQAMARLSHPAIAQIFEAGTTDDGFPYFVMEHVPGESLTDYCDRRSSSFEQRLELFFDICQGVEHAHRKGILHRDLKPTNVLVAEIDGKATPKIIDFGIAKALDRPLTELTLQTAGAIGTPSYMSPEALDGSDVDTRADVYALGILLFELLVGQKPFDLKGLGLAQVFQRIKQQETPRPSQRYRTLPLLNQDAIAEQRKQNRKQLQQSLEGDLDWIIGKATAHERDRRYGSATELALDIRRHLDNQPVAAGPPTSSYRLAKFVRRNRGIVAAGSLAILALIAGTVGTTVGMLRAQQEAARASQEAENTRQALLDTEEVTDFLVQLFEVSDPKEAGGENLSARQLLDRGAERVDEQLAAQPLRRARLMHTIGTIYHQLQVQQEAKTLVQTALELRQQELPSDHSEVAESLYRLAVIERDLAQYEAAEAAARGALEIRRKTLGKEHPKVGESLRELAVVLYLSGEFDEAETLIRRSLEIAETQLGPDVPAVADALETWGNLLKDQGRCSDAIALFERSLQIRQLKLGPLDPKLSYALNNLGSCYGEAQQFDKARPLFEQALKIQEKVLGPQAAPVAMARTNLSIIYRELGELDLAEAALARARDDLSAALGADHPLVANCMAELGVLLWQQGRLTEAEIFLQDALGIWRVKPGPEHPWTAWAHWGLANVLRDDGRLDASEQHYMRSLEVRAKVLPAGHPEVRDSLVDYGKMLHLAGRSEEAEAMERMVESQFTDSD